LTENKKYEVLDSLPAYGPMYIPISENGEQFSSEGFVVRFFKDDKTEWVANFAAGWGIDKVFDYPDKNIVVVFASGIGYVMNPNEEKPIKIIGSMTKDIFKMDNGDLFCIDDIGIEIFDCKTYEIWTSERISWDGFKDLTFENGIVKGKSFDPTNSIKEWSDFSFNTDNKELIGGSFRDTLERNPHLEVENRVKIKTKEKKPWWKIW
jgi:hypothetical protein